VSEGWRDRGVARGRGHPPHHSRPTCRGAGILACMEIRHSVCLVVVALAVTGPSACKRKKNAVHGPMSTVAMNDAGAASQLKSGFYGIEGGSWRWTARNFSVALLQPAGSAQKGSRLHLKFTLPDAVINQVGPMQLSASVNGAALKPELYSKAGDYDYARDVEAGSQAGLVTVDFSCDKALAPSGDEQRELALIAVSVGLESH